MKHQREGETAATGGLVADETDPLATDAWARLGRVSRVQVYPLKSAAAPAAAAVALAAVGAVGDRWFLVTDRDGKPVTAEQAPELRSVVALLAMDGGLVLQVPGTPGSVRGDRADDALSDLIGRPVRVVPAARSASRLDAPVHLVSVQAIDAARRGEHVAADCACSLEEPRANLLVDLTGSLGHAVPEGQPGADGGKREGPLAQARFEAALVGRRLRIGTAVLRVTRTPGHCLGIYADVLTPGTVRPGETVEVSPVVVPAAVGPKRAKPKAKAAELDRAGPDGAGSDAAGSDAAGPDAAGPDAAGPDGSDDVIDLREPEPIPAGAARARKPAGSARRR